MTAEGYDGNTVFLVPSDSVGVEEEGEDPVTFDFTPKLKVKSPVSTLMK
jgi:hypothetical protein